MSLSIMHFSPSTVYSSQSPAHSHRHQPQVQRLREHDGIHQHVVLPPRSVLLLPPAPLPFGWDLATTAEGTLYYLVHNRGISNWERPEYPAIPPKPPKHRSANCVGQSGPRDWGFGHVFEGKLYFTKDIVDDSFVPRNRKPKPIPKPTAKPTPTPDSASI
jgi:hypothetical protein